MKQITTIKLKKEKKTVKETIRTASGFKQMAGKSTGNREGSDNLVSKVSLLPIPWMREKETEVCSGDVYPNICDVH